jgi:hypothetical protein
MVFNELCEDGVVRPVSVQPRLIGHRLWH